MGLIGAMDKHLKDKMMTYFFLVDTNGDGMLDREEVEDMVTNSGKFEADEVKDLVAKVFAELERDTENGVVSTAAIGVEEFSNAVVKNPNLLEIFELCFA